jgi:hypothetical protein
MISRWLLSQFSEGFRHVPAALLSQYLHPSFPLQLQLPVLC